MTGQQFSPGTLKVPTGDADGAYVVIKDGVRFTQFGHLVDGTRTTIDIDPITGAVSVDASGGSAEPYSIVDYVDPGETLVDDGSGPGDNSTIVQRAVDALHTLYLADDRPRQIFFPDGTYELAEAGIIDGIHYAVRWRSGVGIATSSRRGVIFLADATSTPFFAGYSASGVANIYCDPHVVDGAAQDNATYTTGLKGWFLQDVSDSAWNDVLIRNCFATGFGCDFLRRVTVTGRAENNGRGLAETFSDPLTHSGGTGFGIGTGMYEVEEFTFDVTTSGNGLHGCFTETQTSATFPYSRGGRIRLRSEGDFIGFRDCGCDGLIADLVIIDPVHAGIRHDKTILAPHAGINGRTRFEISGSASHGLILADCSQGPYTFSGAAHHNTGSGVIAGTGAIFSANMCFEDLDLHDNGGDGFTISTSSTSMSLVGVRAWTNTGDDFALRGAAKTATNVTVLACEFDGTVVLEQTIGGTPMIHGNRGLDDNPAAAAPAATSGELLMQNGVTAPPVPLETEARDDWLYEG